MRALLLAVLTASTAHAESRRIGRSGWEIVIPPGARDRRSGDASFELTNGYTFTVRRGPPDVVAKAMAPECENGPAPAITGGFDDIHPNYTTVAYKCGSDLEYKLLYETNPGGTGGALIASVITVELKPGERVAGSAQAVFRSVLEGLNPTIQAAPPPPGLPPKAPRPKTALPRGGFKTWGALVDFVLAEGEKVLVKGEEAAAFKIADPTPAKGLTFAAAEASDGVARSAMVAVRPGPNGMEPAEILLRAGRGFYRLSLQGRPRGAAANLEKEREFYLQGKHRAKR